MLKSLFFLLTILILTSCGLNDQSEKKSNSKIFSVVIIGDSKNGIENALKFINGYVQNCNKMNKALETIDWVNSSKLSTDNFKKEIKKIITEAYEKDPELGLDADPIFDAQDYPDEGFELEAFDEKTNYLTVRGKKWPQFKLTMKIVNKKQEWLVDGCGIVNIPNAKRAER